MAAGKINLQKASGGITTITGVDGVSNTEVVLPESGTLATTAGATETVSGIIELATTAETQAGTDDTRAITPLKLFDSLKGSNQSLAASGYQKLHGGLIFQWVKFTSTGAGDQTINFPISFPNSALAISTGGRIGGILYDNPASFSATIISNSQFQANRSDSITSNFDYVIIAIGY